MGFKSQNKTMGNVPEWKVDKGLPSLSWELYKERVKDLEDQIASLTQHNKDLQEHTSKFLTKDELMFLLHFIKEANFKGGQLEHVFQVTLKLQDQYRFLEQQENSKG